MTAGSQGAPQSSIFTLGRSEACDVQISHPSVSRMQARLYVSQLEESGSWSLRIVAQHVGESARPHPRTGLRAAPRGSARLPEAGRAWLNSFVH